MIIERTDSEVIIRLPSDIGIINLDRVTRYIEYLESVKDSQAIEDEVDKLAKKSKKRWWKENKSKFII